MAAGKTIITTSIGTEGINSTPGKNILIADNPEDFIKELNKVLTNPSIFDEIGKNAVKFVREQFDADSISASLEEFYKKNKT